VGEEHIDVKESSEVEEKDSEVKKEDSEVEKDS
jgi:hypothetical protein